MLNLLPEICFPVEPKKGDYQFHIKGDKKQCIRPSD